MHLMYIAGLSSKPRLLLVHGKDGSGCTALLADWGHEASTLFGGDDPHKKHMLCVVHHFFGLSGEAADFGEMLRRVTDAVRQHYADVLTTVPATSACHGELSRATSISCGTDHHGGRETHQAM